MIGDFIIPIACGVIGASVSAVVCCFVRDSRLDDLRRELEARMANSDQIQADWDNRLKSRVQRLERSDREVRLRLIEQDAQLRRVADALEGLQSTHDAIGDAIAFHLPGEAVTDSPTDDVILQLAGGRPRRDGA